MLKAIKLSFKTFASFTLALSKLSFCASCFFALAENLFGAELSGTLGITKLQAVSELVLHRSADCLFVMAMLCVFFLLLVLTGVVALGVVRFCAWPVAERAFLSAMCSLRSFNDRFRRFVARFFVLLIENSLCLYKTVKDGSWTKIQGLWEAGRLKMLVFAAAVQQATASHHQFVSKRDPRVVLCVYFVFNLLMVLIAVVGARRGMDELFSGAVWLMLIAEELRRSSAATKATRPARSDHAETSSCHHFDPARPLGESYDDFVAVDGQLDQFATTGGLNGGNSASSSDEHLFPCRRSMIRIGNARYQVVHVPNTVVKVRPTTPSAPVKVKRTFKGSLPAPVVLAFTAAPVDMDWEPTPPTPIRLNRKRCLEDPAAAVSSKRQRTLDDDSNLIVEDAAEDTSAAGYIGDDKVDMDELYTNNQPAYSSDLELTDDGSSKSHAEADDCVGASGYEESENWHLWSVGFLPVIPEENEEEEEEEEEDLLITTAVDADDDDDVAFLLPVCIGVIALGGVHFCTWTVAEAIVRAMKGLSFVGRLILRFVARFFVLLIDHSVISNDAVKDGSQMEFLGLLDARRLEMMPVLRATSYHRFGLKRDRRIAFRVSFVFIVRLVLTGVVGALGGVSWLRFSAVGLLFIAEELRRSSAAKKATLLARLDLVETSSCRDFDPSRHRYGSASPIEEVDWLDWLDWLGTESVQMRCCRHRSLDSGLRKEAVTRGLGRCFLAIKAVSLKFFCGGAKSTVEDEDETAITGGSFAKRGRRRARFMADKSRLFSYQTIKSREQMSAEEFSERYDRRFMSRDFLVSKRQEVAWERQFEVFPSDDFFDSDGYRMHEGLVPAFSDETFFLDEKGEKCHPAHWSAFSTDFVPFLRQLGVIPPGFASWDVYESYLRSYHEFYQTCIKWYDHHFCGMAVEPLSLLEEDDDEGDKDDNSKAPEVEENEAPEAMDLESLDYYSSVLSQADERLLLVGYLPGILEECEEEADMEEEDLVIDTVVDAEDEMTMVVVEEEEPEREVLDAGVLPRRTRKLKTFGPCNRTRPHLKRKCKENVRYTK